MNETMVKYLAGLLDADGTLGYSFRIDPRGRSVYFVGLRMGLASSAAVDKEGFIKALHEKTGMGHLAVHGEDGKFHTWVVAKRSDLEMLLPRLIKHMVIKAKHWQWMLDRWRAGRSGDRGGWVLSPEEKERLVEESKLSRRTRVGPLKPKNHPTWAWLAGYLDGDGTYHYRSNRAHTGYVQWQLAVSAVAHVNDIHVLEFLQKAFGGQIAGQGQSDNVKVWRRSLGYQNKDFALRFLPNLAKHSKLKRDKIDAIISHHQQRLSVPGMERNYCRIDGCDRPAAGHKLCNMHYTRWRRHGDPLHVSDSLSARK